MQQKIAECTDKIRDLGSLPSDSFDKYHSMPSKQLFKQLEKANSELKKYRCVLTFESVGPFFFFLYIRCLGFWLVMWIKKPWTSSYRSLRRKRNFWSAKTNWIEDTTRSRSWWALWSIANTRPSSSLSNKSPSTSLKSSSVLFQPDTRILRYSFRIHEESWC